MSSSQEFLKRVVEERGIATREKVAELLGKVTGEKPLATLLIEDGLLADKEMVTLLKSYSVEEQKAGRNAAAESAHFGSALIEKGMANGSDVWFAIAMQEKDRESGEEKSLDWHLSRSGQVEWSKSVEVLSAIGRKPMSCRDCGRREILSAEKAAGKPTCPECGGIMEVARSAESSPSKQALGKDPMIGREIGGCVIETLLGRGGMGAVYKARHLSLNKTVAVKILSGALGNESARKRFLREARTAARLEHPNIVQVYDTGSDGDYYFIVMQFIEGQSAAAMARKGGPIPVDEALRIAIEAGKGLRAAHKIGLVHRDMKPDNIMIDTEGLVKVADFGLVKEQSSDAPGSLTATGQVMGTPHYMSPEQAKDASAVGPACDIYSLGATLFAMLTGKPPFEGSTPWAVVSAVLNDPVPDLRTALPDAPEEVATVVSKLMQKDPSKRPTDMTMAVEELAKVRMGLTNPVAAREQFGTLDDFKTPPPGSLTALAPPSKTMATLEDFPTPATFVKRPKKKGSWVFPAIVGGVLVVTGVVAGAIFVPGFLPNKPGAAPAPQSAPEDKKQPDPAEKPVQTARDLALEQEAGDALRSAKARADSHLAGERYPEAIAEYTTLPSRFKSTEAWSMADEEKARVFNIALARFKTRMEELERKSADNKVFEARMLAQELAAALGKVRETWGGDLPESATGLESRVATERNRLDAIEADRKWLENSLANADKLSPEDEKPVRSRAGGLKKSPVPEIASAANRLLEKLDATALARADAKEGVEFKIALGKAKEALDLGDPDFAEKQVEPFGSSRQRSVRDGVAALKKQAGSLRDEMKVFQAVLDSMDRKTLSGLRSAMIALKPFFESSHVCIMGRSRARMDELELAWSKIRDEWSSRDFAAFGPVEAEVGSDDETDANPKRRITLKPFAIGLREVTCAEYAEFVASGEKQAPSGWINGKPAEGKGDLPVTMVSAEDAAAYCAWLGKKNGWKARLPNEDEWEVAAGGSGLQTATAVSINLCRYPWGNTYEAGAANLSSGQPIPAGGFPRDVSACRAVDMAGNVCEWCTLSPTRPVAPSPSRSGEYVIKGGCFDDGENSPSARCSFRQTAGPGMKQPRIGFRVCIELD